MAPAKKRQRNQIQLPEFRPWAELPPEILGLIFQFFNLQDRLIKLPSICKAWSRALKGPYCWKDIDIHDWACQRKQIRSPRRISRMLLTLITRSGRSFEKLCVFALSSPDVTLIADNAKNLRTLKLTFSKISEEDLEMLASKLPSLTSLDIRQCKNIGTRGLEAIGKSCKNLTSLCYYASNNFATGQISGDLAHAIANTMHKLKKLEISNLQLGKKAQMGIITNCKDLEEFDLTGCAALKISEEYLKSFPNLKIVAPDDGYCDINYFSFLLSVRPFIRL